jgi:hypothetical protein
VVARHLRLAATVVAVFGSLATIAGGTAAAAPGSNFRWAPNLATADHWSCGSGGGGSSCFATGTGAVPLLGRAHYSWSWNETNGIPGRPDSLQGWVYDLSETLSLTLTTPRGSLSIEASASCTATDPSAGCDDAPKRWSVTAASGAYRHWTGSGAFAGPIAPSSVGFTPLVGRISPHA